MHSATLTEKFQICIPKAFRDDLGLKAGQQFVFVAKGDTIIMIPRREMSEVRGMFKGANTKKFATARIVTDAPGRYPWLDRMAD